MTENFNGSHTTQSVGLPAALQRAADAVSLAGGWIAGLCIIGLTLLVLIDTGLAGLSRILPFLPNGTGIGWEYSAYLMGSAFLLGSGMTLRAGLQLRVELTLSPNRKRLTHVLETFSALLGTVITGSLTIWLFNFTSRTYGYGEVSDSFTPLWIPQAVLTLGAGVLAFQMFARLVTCLSGGSINNPDLGAGTAIK
ncbi:TRAP-type mannitol/chloroaromatic compound transport system permease small subunit [Pacificibacter maritimus]|uniref:TRAP transporter small permease protein n=1 Tax=Pacificibacter maritimus TaxID=762213 RepID=A0A3N4U9W9_9RHOB|nr:TRAP transporter small permease [Pacificibacter maritimus]RPE66568.1 TRAP-type mannitol/chloroaromatic compound transport system permease small subunit [Pacificibacter maritimus]